MPEWSLITQQLVQLPTNLGSLQSIWASSSHPVLVSLYKPEIYTTAITIALVASIESLLCIQAIDKLDPDHKKTSLNRELIAQGV